MQIALIHAHFDRAHLEAVQLEMGTVGAPTIRAVWMECFGVWAALEGCHRLRAAHALGLVPDIDEVEYSEELLRDLGLEDESGELTVAAVADDAHAAVLLRFAA